VNILSIKLYAVIYHLVTAFIIAAPAAFSIEQFAADISIENLVVIHILQFDQTTFGTAITE
jgi:hypothetical protein